jgi:putative ABC transport system permease protein
MSQFWADLRFALRSMGRRWTFFATAIAMLAGSLGATTAMFGLARSLLLSPLPLPESERLSVLWTTRAEENRFKASLPDFYDWRARTKTLSHLTGMRSWLFAMSLPERPAEGVSGDHVVGDFFGTLGLTRALHGRLLTERDDTPGGPRVVVLSEPLWRLTFGGDPNLVGSSIQLDGEPYTVVGVAPEDFAFGFPGQMRSHVWVPLSVGPLEYAAQIREARDRHEFNAVARRKPGVTEAEARAELSAIAADISSKNPSHRIGVQLGSLHTEAVRTSREFIWALFAAVGLVFLLVCSNLASLFMSHNHARSAELSLRAALGASRGILVRQLVTESVLLYVLAVPFAAFVAHALLGTFYGLAATELAEVGIPVKLDGLVLASAALVSLLSGLLFGVIPALSATRLELASVLKESAAAASPGGSQRRVRSALVVTQLAIAQALLLCTGLSIHALVQQLRAPLGFEPKNVVVGAVLASSQKYLDPAQVSAFYDRVLEKFSALPYVQSAAINNSTPPYDFEAISFEIEGQTAERRPMFEQHDRISPGYFRTLAIPLLSGRDFDAADAKGPPVLIVSRSAESRFFGGRALGQRVRLDDEERAREIVGVVGDVQRPGLGRSTQLEAYLPYAQSPFQSMRVLVKTTEPARVRFEFQQLVSSVDPEVPVVETWPLDGSVTWYAIGRSLATFLLGVFSALALFLATLGTYGLASHLTQQRTREIGIRMALGSPPASVCWLIVRSGLSTVAAGVAIGWLVALAAGQAVSSFVPGALAFQAALFAGAPLVLLSSAGLAFLIPAWNAVRISPAKALRRE